MKPSVYIKYVWNVSKKNRLRKRLTTAVCAGAVAFTAMSMGFLGEYMSQLNGFMRNISERELILYHNTATENPYAIDNPPIPAEAVEQMGKIRGVETVAPLLSFTSIPFSPYTRDHYNEDAAVEPAQPSESTIKCVNENGLQKEAVVNTSVNDEEHITITAVSYPSAELMDRKALYFDPSVEQGAYLTEDLMERLELTAEDLNGLTVVFDVWIFTAQREEKVIETYFDDNGGVLYEAEATSYMPFSQKITVTAEVRGVVPSPQDSQAGNILMPAEQMLQLMRDCPPDTETMDLIVKRSKEVHPDVEIQPFTAWSPSAYYLVADSAETIGAVKDELQKLDPNFTVQSQFQDLQAGTQIISNHRNVMVYISLAVLTVVFLLTALVYVSLIDKRKYEFAVLRANGLTKREVRRVVYAEMLLQFALIFVVGLLFAALIYFIGGRWLGYPFQFDGLTVLWLFLISLGAVVLPTVISLLFVNRFEPDQVMRN